MKALVETKIGCLVDRCEAKDCQFASGNHGGLNRRGRSLK